jgi:hypothetical protein
MCVVNVYMYLHIKFETKTQKYVTYTKVTNNIVRKIRSRCVLFIV